MNYETRCVKIKFKPDSIEKVRSWAQTINERKTEALATLRGEVVILEAVFLDRNSEGDFLIYVMKAGNFEKSKQAVQNSIHAIDEYHQNFKSECWEDGKRLETLLDLDGISKITSD